MMGAIWEANCFNNQVGMRSNAHVFFSRLRISVTVAGSVSLRGGTFLLTMTGGSAERVAARILSTLPLKNWVKWSAGSSSEVHCVGGGATCRQPCALGLCPQELTVDSISTGTADAACRTADARLSPSQRCVVDGTVAPVFWCGA